ncbi:MAG: hypothetical protein GSR85_00715 [Desulfurococcales archaeon]|nr:hypothetical protein [Desulfurococcales archaeon]
MTKETEIKEALCDTDKDDFIFEKMIMLVGTTGINFTRFLEYAKEALRPSDSMCAAKFEQYLKLSGPCYTIADAVALLQFAGQEAERAFEDAAQRLAKHLKEKGCKNIVISAHMTYMIGGEPSTIPNPALSILMRLARKTIIVHVIEDWYDSIKRIAKKGIERQDESLCQSKPLGFNIDHEIILSWRQTDMNVAQTVLKFTPKSSWILLANKHPEETIRDLIEYLLYKYNPEEPKPLDHVLAYISHPITDLRSYHNKIRAIIRYFADKKKNTQQIVLPPLGLNPLVAIMEGVKDFIKKHYRELRYYQEESSRDSPKILLFEPTTIDELLYDYYIIEEDEKSPPDLQARKVLPPLFLPSLRWPWRYSLKDRYDWWYSDWVCGKMEKADLLHEDLSYTYKSDIKALINTLSEKLTSNREYGQKENHRHSRGEEKHGTLATSDRTTETHNSLSSVLDMYNQRVESVIKSQIEMRDFMYVNQSDILIATLPAIIYRKKANGDTRGERAATQTDLSSDLSLFLIESSGVTNEVLRAFSLGKHIVVLVVPITGSALLETTERLVKIYLEYNGVVNKIQNKQEELILRIIKDLMKDKINERNALEFDETDSLTVTTTVTTLLQRRLAAGGPFMLLPRQAKIIILPPITKKDVKKILELVENTLRAKKNNMSREECFNLELYSKLAEIISRKIEREKDSIQVVVEDP